MQSVTILRRISPVPFAYVMVLVLTTVLLFFSCEGEKVKPHILLITIDTLRRDHVGAYGYYRETSPFIDRLAREGVMFRNVITPFPLTAPSHASILTSLHPLTHNVLTNGSTLSDKVQTIAEVLKKNGYYAIGTVAVAILRKEKNFYQGFNSFSDQWKKEKGLNSTLPFAERTAPSVNKSLFAQIDEYDRKHKNQPLFIWVHYYDPHLPYYNHKNIQFKADLEKGKPKGINLYDKEIRYLDEHIKMLYNYLEKKGLKKRLITCITADHGEQLGEHGYTYDHVDFYSETTFVPLVFHGLRIPQNKTIDTYASTMDIGVTLLGMAGFAFDYPTEGIDLNKLIKNPRTHLQRKFLIIGRPNYSRSPQLLGYPFAYILNFDYHYQYWYISHHPAAGISENRFKPLRKEQIEILENQINIPLPYVPKRGCGYVVLRADIQKNEGLSVRIKVKPFLLTDKVQAAGTTEKIAHLEIVYPVTISDHLSVFLFPKGNTSLDNFRYVFITKDEFPGQANFTKKIKNSIYKKLNKKRKRSNFSEFFDLAADIGMEKNQINTRKFKPTIMEYEKLIYTVFDYYLKKKDQLLSGSTEAHQLTQEDKKILKSLGYL